jgi:hypothetical protein
MTKIHSMYVGGTMLLNCLEYSTLMTRKSFYVPSSSDLLTKDVPPVALVNIAWSGLAKMALSVHELAPMERDVLDRAFGTPS